MIFKAMEFSDPQLRCIVAPHDDPKGQDEDKSVKGKVPESDDKDEPIMANLMSSRSMDECP